MLEAGSQVGGTQLNPVGTPVWQLGQPHAFRLFWDWTVGTLTWQIDFNRDNSFGAGETASFSRVPEPASWVMLVVGFGAVGAALRRRRTVVAS